MYKILKHGGPSAGSEGFWVNDSEGIPMEWETFEVADKIAKLFQSNTKHGYTYTVIKII